jgi:antibiotic biosynthesis monooxygenase (ABM) superfamily enzyme
MLIRSAFWIGRPVAGRETWFRQQLDKHVLPAMSRLPGVLGVRALWPEHREDDPPDIHCQIVVEFDDEAAMQRMLASSERAALRPQVLALVQAFDGRMSHINYRVG